MSVVGVRKAGGKTQNHSNASNNIFHGLDVDEWGMIAGIFFMIFNYFPNGEASLYYYLLKYFCMLMKKEIINFNIS